MSLPLPRKLPIISIAIKAMSDSLISPDSSYKWYMGRLEKHNTCGTESLRRYEKSQGSETEQRNKILRQPPSASSPCQYAQDYHHVSEFAHSEG